MIKKGLLPLSDKNTRILILGSLPSDISITEEKYYANKANDFWKILSDVLNEDLNSLSYEKKIQKLKEEFIGLWDVYHSCYREGSMDANMSNKELNDFSMLTRQCPNLKLICFNGKEAGLNENIFAELGYKTKVLPSTSGANRRDQEGRLIEWKIIKA